MAVLKVQIINPDAIAFEGEAQYLTAPTPKGGVGIMHGHTPFFTEISKGEIYVKGEKEELVPVENGILKIVNDEVTILISPT